MSISGTNSGLGIDQKEISEIQAPASSVRNVKLTELQMNIAEELESNISATSLDKVSQGRRTILRKVLGKNFEDKENLISKEQDLCEDLPEGTRKLFEEYSNREKFKQELTREEFEKILSGKLRYLGEGQFGVVYESEDGKYALKFPRNGESISDDRLKNEALKKNTGAFDPKQAYYQQKDEFIARYVGTFKTREGIEVVVFEKIDGEEFQKCVVENPASLFRLLAQAATAIAIFNEAGCINSDIKPNNMMVTNDLYLLKLIDQGSAINLLQKKEKTSTPLSKLPLESTTPLKRFNPENDKPSSTRLSESIFVPATPLYRPPLGSATPLKGLPRGPVTPLVKFKSKESPAVPFEPSTPLASFNPGSDESPSTRLSESLFIPTTPLARQPLGSATPLKRGETPRTGFKPKSDESPLTPSGAFFGSATPLARQPRGTATPLVKRFSSPNLVSGSESEELVSMTCTPTYAAPEVMIGFETKNTELFTPAVDVYSLGVSILEKLKDINDVGTQENIEEILVSLYNTFFVSDFEYRNAVSGQIANWCERSIVIPGDEAGSKFIGLLLSDCLAFNPEDRISAAQAAEILQVFSSYLEAKETNPGLKCPNYRVVKATAIKDSPKGIPIAIRKMLYDADPNMQQEAISIIENLVRADASYTNTPSYGLALLLKKPSRTPSDITFEDWAKDKRNFNSAKQLRERAYIREKDHSKEQDIPVSEEIYEIITSTIDLSDFEPEIDPSEPNSDSDSNVPNRTDQPNVSSARPRVPEKRNTI